MDWSSMESRIFHRPMTMKRFHKLDRAGLIFSREDYDPYSIGPFPADGNLILNGKFEVPEYFEKIRDIFVKEFTPKYPEREQNKELYDIIRSTNSVCISIRRGDFVTNKDIANDFCVCDKTYFERAMAKAKELIPNPTFIFFSDDIQWAKENIPVDVPAYYEKGNDPIWEKLRLMYSCKHFIISNSTFSWWVQYLGRDPHKIVISPDRWWNNPRWHAYLIEKQFIKINK